VKRRRTVPITPTQKNRISDLLAAYGADVARWPDAEIRHVEHLTAEEREQLFRNDSALDRLLVQVQKTEDTSQPSADLMNRIMAARVDDSATVSSAPTAAVVNLEPDEQSRQKPGVPARPHPMSQWTAVATLLAASLVLGIFVGSTDIGQATTALIGDVAGLTVAVPDVQTSALDEVLQLSDDEGIL